MREYPRRHLYQFDALAARLAPRRGMQQFLKNLGRDFAGKRITRERLNQRPACGAHVGVVAGPSGLQQYGGIAVESHAGRPVI